MWAAISAVHLAVRASAALRERFPPTASALPEAVRSGATTNLTRVGSSASATCLTGQAIAAAELWRRAHSRVTLSISTISGSTCSLLGSAIHGSRHGLSISRAAAPGHTPAQTSLLLALK